MVFNYRRSKMVPWLVRSFCLIGLAISSKLLLSSLRAAPLGTTYTVFMSTVLHADSSRNVTIHRMASIHSEQDVAVDTDEPEPTMTKISSVTENRKGYERQDLQNITSSETASLAVSRLTTSPPRQPLPRPIRLLRIPKAGSSSFSAFLRNQYNCTSEEKPPGDCTKRNRLLCEVVVGCSNHWPPPKDWKTNRNVEPMVTFVRDPIDRYMSAYSYPGHHGKGTGKNVTLHTILFPEFDNTQTNFLSGNTIGTWGLPGGNKKNKARSEPPKDIMSATEKAFRLESAVELINAPNLRFVGLVEYWNDSLLLFCRMYACTKNSDNTLDIQPQRQRSQEEKSQVKESDAVEKSNDSDSALYRAAILRFCRDLAMFRDDTDFFETLQERTIQLCSID